MLDIELTRGYNSAGDKRFIVLRGTESQKTDSVCILKLTGGGDGYSGTHDA